MFIKKDTLYTIFENHLEQFNDAETDRRTFVEKVVSEYVSSLRKVRMVIPSLFEKSFREEVNQQVTTMLLHKIHGLDTLPPKTKLKRKRKIG